MPMTPTKVKAAAEALTSGDRVLGPALSVLHPLAVSQTASTLFRQREKRDISMGNQTGGYLIGNGSFNSPPGVEFLKFIKLTYEGTWYSLLHYMDPSLSTLHLTLGICLELRMVIGLVIVHLLTFARPLASPSHYKYREGVFRNNQFQLQFLLVVNNIYYHHQTEFILIKLTRRAALVCFTSQ